MKLTTKEKLETIMRREGITVTDLAKRLGQSRQNVAVKINRDNLTEKDLKQFSNAIGYDYDIIFTKKE